MLKFFTRNVTISITDKRVSHPSLISPEDCTTDTRQKVGPTRFVHIKGATRETFNINCLFF